MRTNFYSWETSMCIFSPQFRRQKQQLHQNSFEQNNTTSEAVWLGYLLKHFFFFFSGNISSGKHKHGSYSLLQNLTPPSSYKSQSFVQVLRSWHLLQVTVGRLTKLSAIVSELQRTQAFKCTAKEKDLRINRKWWFFQAQKHLDKTSGTNRHRKATGP